jgi:hypothetical protein
MNKPVFLIWRNRYDEGYSVVTNPHVKDDHELSEGVSRAKGWPDDVKAPMSPEYPKDILLPDNVSGTELVIISHKLRQALVAECVTNVEYLLLTIIDHKKKVASRDYFIMNPPSVVDCIDLEASEVKWNAIDKSMISRCKQLVLKESNVPKDVKVFRPKHLPNQILIRSDLVKKLEGAGLTGLHFTDPAKFHGV